MPECKICREEVEQPCTGGTECSTCPRFIGTPWTPEDWELASYHGQRDRLFVALARLLSNSPDAREHAQTLITRIRKIEPDPLPEV